MVTVIGTVISLVGSYLLFFAMLYGYEKAVQHLDPVLRMAHTWELPQQQPSKRPKQKGKVGCDIQLLKHLRRVK